MDEQTTTACVRHAYELLGDEVGFFMAGNRQLSARDIAAFASSGSDMQYGEVLPAGMERIAKLDRILGKKTEAAEQVASQVPPSSPPPLVLQTRDGCTISDGGGIPAEGAHT